MSYEPSNFSPAPMPTPTGGEAWTYVSGPEDDLNTMKHQNRRRPNVHWLDSDNWYAGLEWGVDPISAFVARLQPWINDVNNPELQDGDTIVGKDKNGLEVVIHANRLADAPEKDEQQEAPK